MIDERHSIGDKMPKGIRPSGEVSKHFFIVVLDGSGYMPMYERMLADLRRCENVIFIIDKQNNSGLKNILMRDKVRRYLKGRFDWMAIEKNTLFDAISTESQKNKNVVVVFLNAALYYNSYLAGSIKYYKKKWPAIRTVLFYLDIVGVGVCKNADYLREEGLFDLVYTVDAPDAERIGAVQWPTFYSTDPAMIRKIPVNDMYFCGALKGRAGMLKQCAEEAEKNGSQVEMDIICDKQDIRMKDVQGVRTHSFDEFMSYPEVLERELEAKCMLEIVQEGQTALTLRPYEAVAYNRKLLTNNRSILNFTFYDNRYMRYFETPDDIDWDWVKEDLNVDYGYKGEFSPVYLLEDIAEKLVY